MSPNESAITVFAVPKPFQGHIGVIQRNAIHSWTLLRPQPQIILFGDDQGTAEVARELGAVHVPCVRRNEYGTPLVDDLFQQARQLAVHPVLAYANADIVLLSDFSAAVDRLVRAGFEKFLMIGQRTDVDLGEPVDFQAADWERKLRAFVAGAGSLAPRVCKDYFVFTRPLYSDVPPFAIGRGNWDNWIVYHAHQTGVPVVDATRVVTAVHPNHDYAHVGGSKKQVYVTGEEAKRNRGLAGGMHLVGGSVATWVLTPSGVKRRAPLLPLLLFLADWFRFSKLLLELSGLRKACSNK